MKSREKKHPKGMKFIIQNVLFPPAINDAKGKINHTVKAIEIWQRMGSWRDDARRASPIPVCMFCCEQEA